MTTPLLHLYRTSDDGFCTLGRLVLPNSESFATLERPWKENARGLSCIPAGEYAMQYTLSNRFKKRLYILLNVPGRDGIRVHAANWPSELEGCIALGLHHGVRRVLQSRIAMDRFHATMAGVPARLKVHAAPSAPSKST